MSALEELEKEYTPIEIGMLFLRDNGFTATAEKMAVELASLRKVVDAVREWRSDDWVQACDNPSCVSSDCKLIHAFDEHEVNYEQRK